MQRKWFLFLLLAFVCHLAGLAQGKFVHPPGEYISVNGAKLWVEREGMGEPLFIIAGGPGGSHAPYHSFDTLKDAATLVFIDNYGRGKSDTAQSPEGYSIRRDVEDIEGIRQALKYEKISLLGHSYGSIVAQAYAIRYPEHVRHLIIANGFFSGEMWQANDDNCNHEIKTNYPEIWEELMRMRSAGAHSCDPEHYMLYSKVPYGFLYAYNPDNFRKSLDPGYPNPFNEKLYYQLVGYDGDFIIGGDVAGIDFRKDLKDLKMPVLIIAGRYDRVSVPAFAVQYKRYCPQAQFEMFERSGHNPQIEEPEKEFRIIRTFLQK